MTDINLYDMFYNLNGFLNGSDIVLWAYIPIKDFLKIFASPPPPTLKHPLHNRHHINPY